MSRRPAPEKPREEGAMERKKEYGAEAFLRSVKEMRVEKRRCELRLEELRSQCER